MDRSGTLGTFLRTQAGVVAAIVLIGFGVSAGVWVYKADNRVRVIEERLLYVICTSVPPQTRNELRALRVDCKPVQSELNSTKQGLTIDELLERLKKLEEETVKEIDVHK